MEPPWATAPAPTNSARPWFTAPDSAAPLRICDVADPLSPREVGHFIPEPVAGRPSPQSNDVEIDNPSLIYLADRNVGFDIPELRR